MKKRKFSYPNKQIEMNNNRKKLRIIKSNPSNIIYKKMKSSNNTQKKFKNYKK